MTAGTPVVVGLDGSECAEAAFAARPLSSRPAREGVVPTWGRRDER